MSAQDLWKAAGGGCRRKVIKILDAHPDYVDTGICPYSTSSYRCQNNPFNAYVLHEYAPAYGVCFAYCCHTYRLDDYVLHEYVPAYDEASLTPLHRVRSPS